MTISAVARNIRLSPSGPFMSLTALAADVLAGLASQPVASFGPALHPGGTAQSADALFATSFDGQRVFFIIQFDLYSTGVEGAIVDIIIDGALALGFTTYIPAAAQPDHQTFYSIGYYDVPLAGATHKLSMKITAGMNQDPSVKAMTVTLLGQDV